jgi:lipopolysaccharide export system protein LptA
VTTSALASIRLAATVRAPLLAVLFAVLSIAPLAHAERADQTKPLVLEADNASYDDLKQIYVLTGNVVLTKGTMVLRSHTAEVRTDPEGYQYAVAIAKAGELAYIRQKRDTPNEFMEGWAERIEYDGKQEVSKLIRRARMARLEGSTVADEIRGALITYDSRNAFYTASGGDGTAASPNGSGRVRAVLAPRGGNSTNATGTGTAPDVILQPAPAPRQPR